MPLLEERSQLSNWHKVDTSDKYTNLRGEIRGGIDVGNVPIPTTPIGVNYFLDIHATGFTVKRKHLGKTEFFLNDEGGPKIPQTGYYGVYPHSWNPKFTFSVNNKAFPNVYNLDDSPATTPLQKIPKPTNLFLDRNGDFSPVFDTNNKPSVDIKQSRLWKLHNEGVTSTSPLRDTHAG